MSLITRCPACGTMFKVVPDQLRISEGWVRCGHCSEVFDASLHMQQPGMPAAPIEAPAPHVQQPEPQMAPYVEPPLPEPLRSPPPEPVEPQMEPFDPFIASPEPVAHEPVTGTPAAETPLEAAHRPGLLVEYPPFEGPEYGAVDGLSTDEAAAQADAELNNVSFVRDAQRKAFWRRPAVRAGLVFVALLLAVALGLQVAVQERNRIAAMEPALKPYLQMLCQPLECTVGPPRQIEAIVIDASSFTKLRSDAYRLNFTLKNQAATEVAMPAIELTLTDTLDQPVLRRVLSPSDLGAKSPVIEATSEWAGSFALAVAGNGGARIAGYRVLAFYP